MRTTRRKLLFGTGLLLLLSIPAVALAARPLSGTESHTGITVAQLEIWDASFTTQKVEVGTFTLVVTQEDAGVGSIAFQFYGGPNGDICSGGFEPFDFGMNFDLAKYPDEFGGTNVLFQCGTHPLMPVSISCSKVELETSAIVRFFGNDPPPPLGYAGPATVEISLKIDRSKEMSDMVLTIHTPKEAVTYRGQVASSAILPPDLCP